MHGRQRQSGYSGLSTVPFMTGLCETYLASLSIFIHIIFYYINIHLIFISFNLISYHLRRIHGRIRGEH